MIDKLKLILDYGLPILCIVNLVFAVNAGDTNYAIAWAVAFGGWTAALLERFKHDRKTRHSPQ
jgi:hypothetical protein